MKYYFVYCGQSSIETEVIKEMQPPRLMLSHHYWKNKDLGEMKEQLGYDPEIFYDSGAFSAYNSGKVVKMADYLADLERKKDHITKYMALDCLGDNWETFGAYEYMKKSDWDPVPVFQYEKQMDLTYLEKYVELGETFIALGGTVPINNRYEIREYVRLLCWQFPEVDFHLLGTGSKPIINSCDLASADASSWIIAATRYGRPEHIKGTSREARKKRAAWNMQDFLNISS